MSNRHPWDSAQTFERGWWGDCIHTLGEELKQQTYAACMGLREAPHGPGAVAYDLRGVTAVDIGGGPVSLLLKCINRGPSVVVDPCAYPFWVEARYAAAGIAFVRAPGESFASGHFDLALIYNCLQHVDDPERIVANARGVSDHLKMFEWINIPAHEGHPHMLTEELLNRAAGRSGTVRALHSNGCFGEAWYLA